MTSRRFGATTVWGMTPVAPVKVHDNPLARAARARVVDKVFFGLGTIAAIWLAVQVAVTTPIFSWWLVVGVIGIWLVWAYLALPRLNRILSSIYVPDYFIGRTRTSDGLLGDPLNLAFRGTGEQLATAGWTMADPVTLRSSVKIVRSVLLRTSYPEAPVSPLLLFGRTQDAAFQQEVRGNASKRHHVRFWRTPPGWPLPGGTRVDWLASGSYDRAVGLSLFTLQVTHKIDFDIDVERDHIVSSLTSAEPAVSVEVLGDFTTSYHSRNGGGDTVRTDGDLPIVDVSVVPAALDSPSLILAVTAVTTLTHVGGVAASSTNAQWLPDFFGGSVAALLLIALSSSGATEWTTSGRQPLRPHEEPLLPDGL